MSCPPGCHRAPHRTEGVLAWGRENAFAKRGIITLAVIHLSGFPGEVFYYDFSGSLPCSGTGVPNAQRAHSRCPGAAAAPSTPHRPEPQPLPRTPGRAGPRSLRWPGLGAESRATLSLVPRTHRGPRGEGCTGEVRSPPVWCFPAVLAVTFCPCSDPHYAKGRHRD